MVESGKAISGQGTGVSQGTGSGKVRAQENSRSVRWEREGRTLQSRGQWGEAQEAPSLGLNPHWLRDIGPLNLTFHICKRGIIVPNAQG